MRKKGWKAVMDPEFFSAAKRLKRELEQIPKLTEAYEKKAEKLREELSDSEKTVEERRKDLTGIAERFANQELETYRSYTDQEGKRCQEILEVRKLAEKNGKILESAVLKAEEVQEYIDSWEPDDEDDELDEEELWEEVSVVLDRFQQDERFGTSRVTDKKTMGVLEAVSRLAGGDLLTLCLPEGTEISNAVLDGADLPSRLLTNAQASDEGADRKDGMQLRIHLTGFWKFLWRMRQKH